MGTLLYITGNVKRAAAGSFNLYGLDCSDKTAKYLNPDTLAGTKV